MSSPQTPRRTKLVWHTADIVRTAAALAALAAIGASTAIIGWGTLALAVATIKALGGL